jgi:hypothetical protein
VRTSQEVAARLALVDWIDNNYDLVHQALLAMAERCDQHAMDQMDTPALARVMTESASSWRQHAETLTKLYDALPVIED